MFLLAAKWTSFVKMEKSKRDPRALNRFMSTFGFSGIDAKTESDWNPEFHFDSIKRLFIGLKCLKFQLQTDTDSHQQILTCSCLIIWNIGKWVTSKNIRFLFKIFLFCHYINVRKLAWVQKCKKIGRKCQISWCQYINMSEEKSLKFHSVGLTFWCHFLTF